MLQTRKPAAIGARRASGFVDEQQVSGPEDNPSRLLQQAVRAELIGTDTCTALGLTARNHLPLLALCRALIEAGHDPVIPLEAYRGDVLCLRVRSIGDCAALEVNAKGTDFIRFREVRTAPSLRANEEGGL
jgi:hypothetical protein